MSQSQAEINLTSLKETIADLEAKELDSPGGVAPVQIYAQLLSCYLLQSDADNARYLWKRIQPPIKQANPELELIWAVGRHMWVRDFPAIYTALRQDWSDPVKSVMTALEDSIRSRAYKLVSQAYSSISVTDFALFIGVPLDEAVKAALAQGWTADHANQIIFPQKPKTDVTSVLASEQQLGQLTDFVSFLEN